MLHLLQYPSSWEDGDGATLIHGPSEVAGDLAATHTHRFTHGEARWVLRWDVLPSYNGGVTVLPARLLAAAGSLLSLLVGLAVSLLLYQNALIRRRVDLRTAELKMALDRAEEASRAKTNFLAVIGHELRTPLNAVIGFADLLEPVQSTPTSRNYIRFVQGGGRHLLRLVKALLEVAQAEQGELVLDDDEVDLRALVHEAVSLAGSSVGETTAVIDIGLPEALPSIRGDGPRLELVILNLVLNAVRAAGDGGKVTVEALVREDHGIRVTVRDTGPGMAEAQVTASLRIFEQVEGPLNRRHEGLGIGLPLCRHLVRLHGGSLSIDTRPGGGTTVTVDLPPERTLIFAESDVRLRAP
ncbi:MAG: sensor histidine kinase [Thalassobaculum sp.]